MKNIDEYNETFPPDDFKINIEENVFQIANDTRKFEIELYWKRTNYFILFIGAIFTGFISIHFKDSVDPIVKNFSYSLICLGIITTYIWLLSLKGSKYWQENWEWIM